MISSVVPDDFPMSDFELCEVKITVMRKGRMHSITASLKKEDMAGHTVGGVGTALQRTAFNLLKIAVEKTCKPDGDPV